ncbi:flagellar basal-body MS-ring/collar protein FliF [Massilia antarctica]|uniref:flagellar basal-body MS-ring/collar protein FliF n=1 Tax=Massilia antarctica TaxID=2765360 RepID=UPI0006BC146A|nr:flagellar basal-body MS-ring/collar protein FliF [Massilia sp. H27-R4]CUI02867.1 Flagellar M-ring protein FliF [Janthinobacterium sp. CG23_2]CUU26653.1 Flagellar M-ring protein FliF [Janthinobacterium sp. CG23_2]
MASVTENWQALSTQAKTGLVVGVTLIAGLAVGIAVWAYRPDYQVLFADVAAPDASAMTAELDRLKVPYQLADGGNTILVPREMVYKTRLKVMGKDLPLHGAVGFEVFNNADFGMTEFVQKVNYQRAIQGELTRTILSIEGIASARVHLALPEQGLFKKTTAKPKASITIVTKPNHVLAAEQVSGIQRLVAASVPDIQAADVTVLDQHGVALTRNGGGEAAMESASGMLDAKRSADDYLTRKLSKVLDATFGPGETIATVDVLLNLDQSRVTTEEVLPARSGTQEGSPTGVVVRSRQTVRDNLAAGASAAASTARSGESLSSGSTEADYQVGRRVAQSVTTPGATRRLTVAVVVKNPLSDYQMDKLKEVVGLTVGLNSERGDAIIIHSMNTLGSAAGDRGALERASVEAAGARPVAATAAPARAAVPPAAIWAAAALVMLVLLVWAFLRRGQPRAAGTALTVEERERLLLQVRQWIDTKHEPGPNGGLWERP